MYNLPQDIIKFSKKYHISTFYISVDESDGMLIYDTNSHHPDFSNILKIPKEFLYFKEIRGVLNFRNCKRLYDIENLRNIKCIRSGLTFQNCHELICLRGLDNLQFAGSINLKGTGVRKLDGLNPFIEVKQGTISMPKYLSHIDFVGWQESEQIKKVFNFVEAL